MSNRRKLPRQHPVTAMLAPLDGARIPGGCDHCDAYQVIAVHHYGRDVHRITICHDDWCPWLAARERAAGRHV